MTDQPQERYPTPPPLIEFVFCKFCGTLMTILKIEPALQVNCDRINYGCRKCGHNFVKDVRRDVIS